MIGLKEISDLCAGVVVYVCECLCDWGSQSSNTEYRKRPQGKLRRFGL